MKSLTKRIIPGALALLIAVAAVLAVPPAMASAGNNRTVRAGFFAYPGYHDLGNGVPSGYGVDFLRLLQRYTRLNFECVGYENSWEDMQRMLRDGEIDAAVSGSLRKATGEKTVAEFAPEDFYVIVRKGDAELLDEINYGIGQMKLNEGNWSGDLYYEHYNAASSGALAFTKREKDYIQAVQSGEKTVTAIARPDKDPYSFVENGSLTASFRIISRI